MYKKKLGGIIVAGLLTLGGGGVVINQVQISVLPDSERLQVPIEKMLSYETVGTEVVYAYQTNEVPAIENELLDRRTSLTRTVKLGEKLGIFFDAPSPRYKDKDGVWWDTTTATTTVNAFDLQTKSAFPFNLISIAEAQTTTFLSGNPGKGNQTFNVPSDWNNTSNTVECIGSGGKGGNGVGSTSGPGGGGGAYSKITNLTLSGTATYSIGASATTTSVGINVTPVRETYFNGTSSSTSSIFCDWGKFGGDASTATSTAGTSILSIGTTKSSGGDGAPGIAVDNRGGGGGGGSAGNIGVGKNGQRNSGGATGGPGGGGSNGGSSTQGLINAVGVGGNGGAGTDGTGGGVGGTNADGGAGTAGKGAGGGGGGGTAHKGGAGSLDTSFDATHGAGGGGGGGTGGSSGAASGGDGGAGATYGGGGGGGGSNTANAPGNGVTGGQGIIVIIYTPIPPNSTTVNVQDQMFINGGVRTQ